MVIRDIDSLINYIVNYYNDFEKMKKIDEDFYRCVQSCDENNINILMNKMLEWDVTREVLYEDIDIIKEEFGMTPIFNLARQMDFKEGIQFIRKILGYYYTVNEYLEDLQKIGQLDYIIDNMEEIISCINIDAGSGSEVLKKLKKIDEEKLKESYPIIIGKMASKDEKQWDKKFLDSLTMIINEIAQNEKTDLSTVKYVRSGSFSDVYRIGNKVIKFGEERVTDKIPYHRRVLQPLLRRKVDTGNGNLYIEISEYVKTDNSIMEEDVYQVYKELRNDGIIWVDAREANLGRLEKDNIAYFYTWLDVKNESVGYIPETIEKEEPLHEGDCIIIDTDLLFKEEEFNKEILEKKDINLYHYEKFEERYQKEKRKELLQIIKRRKRLKNKKEEFEER